MDSITRRSVANESIFLGLLAVPIGIVSAYGALLLVLSITYIQLLFFGVGLDESAANAVKVPHWRFFLVLTIGGLGVGLITWKLMPDGRQYGPADVIESAHMHGGRLPIRTGLASALASILSIGCGASVGRYGPAVHLGASLGSWLAQLLELGRSARLALLGSGAAAAIAASFNAPLAGVLFVGEVVLGGRALRSFIPIIVASVVGTSIARFHLGEFSIFSISDVSLKSFMEYPLFVVLGFLGGLLAVVFIRVTAWVRCWIDGFGIAVWLRPMLGGVLLGILALGLPQVLGLGDQIIREVLITPFPIVLLLLLIGAKLLATAVSIGFGFSGGVFGPALFIGSMLGSMVGVSLGIFVPDATSSASIYAVAGMAAVLGTVIGAPVTTILIAFELTGSYAITTAVMISVVSAAIAARLTFHYSYFRYQLSMRNVDLYEGREVQFLRAACVTDAISDCYVMVGPETSVADAELLHLNDPATDMVVVNAEGRLVGTLTLFELVTAKRNGLDNSAVAEIVNKPLSLITVDMNMYEVMLTLHNFVGASVPVVTDLKTLRFLGVVTENVVIKAHDTALAEARFEDLGAR